MQTTVRTFIAAAALALAAPLSAKTIEAPASSLSGPPRSTVQRAQVAVGADSARLLTLFRGLQQRAQSEQVEQRMAEIIGVELSTLGFHVELNLDAGEVVAILRNGRGPTLVYRADTGTDLSLRVWSEPTRANDASGDEPRRCGPDAHVAWMLGMAKALVALRSDWAGTLVLVARATRLTAVAPRAAVPDPPALQIPAPDYLVSLRAAAEPIGSLFSVQGFRRAGSDQVELSYERVGTYARSRSASQLGMASARAYGLPENVQFGYLLVGIAEASLDAESEPEPDPESELPASDGATAYAPAPLHLELAAIPLGTKLATVAVLELLAKRPPVSSPKRAAQSAPLDLGLHRY